MSLPRACLLVPLCALGPACEITPDPCDGFKWACISVTATSGPPDTYQVLVAIDDHSVTPPITPYTHPGAPLSYPLRFGVQFTGEFDRHFPGMVTLDISALNDDNLVRGEVRQVVPIIGTDKVPLVIQFGPPIPDMAQPPDLATDLRTPAQDMTPSDLADGR